MSQLILKRLFRVIVTILFIYTAVFFLTRVTGDPVEMMAYDNGLSQQAKEQVIVNLGLDKSLPEQFMTSFFGLFTGNAGNSFYNNRPVTELFFERIPATLMLGLLCLLVTAVIGVILGFISAIFHNTVIDRAILLLTVIAHTVPNFVLGIGLILLFSLILRILPSGGYGGLKYMIMPVMAMSVGPTANVARLTRSSMLDILSQDYLNTSRAKGLPELKVKIYHGLRNAMISVITILGAQLSGIIGGSVVIETVFAWPGIGSLIITGAQSRDYPIVIYGVMLIAISVTFVNFFVDLLYMVVDPRIRIGN